MQAALRGYLAHLAGYTAPLLLTGIVIGLVEAATFREGGEAATPWEALLLSFLIWGVVLPLFSGAGYAAAIAFIGPRHSELRLPALFGATAGAGMVLFGGLGGLNAVARQAGIPFPLLAATIGFALGTAVTLVLLFSRRAAV